MVSAPMERGPGEGRSSIPRLLLAAYALFWLLLAIRPKFRADWALENAIVAIAIPWLAVSYREWRFSNVAYCCMFIFFSLHAIGAHYTYSEVPYDEALRAITGSSLNEALGWDRNHYDRLVHFAYGLLIALPAMELLDRCAPPRGRWRWLLPVLFVMSHSVIYEMVEWIAALLFGGDLGVAYLGTQGDPWDAQKDMFLATLGAVVSVTWTLLQRARR